MLKQTFKKVIGASNYEKISLVKRYLDVHWQRGVRACKPSSKEEGRESPEIKKFCALNGQTFFGYYDVTPFSKNNDRILAMVGPRENRPPVKGEKILVGYFDYHSPTRFREVDKTSTWCWQMGCRLQWFPEDENNLVVYNKMVEGGYGSVIQNIRSKEILTKLQRSIYQIDKDGNHALSLNFSRLHRLRPGYGYSAIGDATEGKACPDNDGVWLVNLATGEEQLILTLKQLSEMSPLPSMEGAEHYVNHLAFNPSGTRFMLFHLWVNNRRRYNRLVTSDLSGQNICTLTSEGLVSHYTWKSDTELLVTMHRKNLGTRYYLISDFSQVLKKIGNGVLNKDGHPSYSPDKSLILTDTYPDKYGEQCVLLYSLDGRLIEVARFYNPCHFRGEVRCDLHPRWDRNGNSLCVDSVQDGGRSLYVVTFYERD